MCVYIYIYIHTHIYMPAVFKSQSWMKCQLMVTYDSVARAVQQPPRRHVANPPSVLLHFPTSFALLLMLFAGAWVVNPHSTNHVNNEYSSTQVITPIHKSKSEEFSCGSAFRCKTAWVTPGDFRCIRGGARLSEHCPEQYRSYRGQVRLSRER